METIKKYPVTAALILINLLVFLAVELTGFREDLYQYNNHMLQWGAMYTPFVLYRGEFYRLFTCMFLHFGLEHLLNNMLVLAVFGERMEPALGKLKFIIVYIFGGLGGNLLSMLVSMRNEDYAVSAGASGAVFAVIGALLFVLLRHKGRYSGISLQRFLIMLVLSIYAGVTSQTVDNTAHVGGLLCGFILTMLIYRQNKDKNLLKTEEKKQNFREYYN